MSHIARAAVMRIFCQRDRFLCLPWKLFLFWDIEKERERERQCRRENNHLSEKTRGTEKDEERQPSAQIQPKSNCMNSPLHSQRKTNRRWRVECANNCMMQTNKKIISSEEEEEEEEWEPVAFARLYVLLFQ